MADEVQGPDLTARARDLPNEPLPEQVLAGGVPTIVIRFPVQNNMMMQFQIGGAINDDQLMKAAAYLTALSSMRTQEGIRRELQVANERLMAQAQLLTPNGHFDPQKGRRN